MLILGFFALTALLPCVAWNVSLTAHCGQRGVRLECTAQTSATAQYCLHPIVTVKFYATDFRYDDDAFHIYALINETSEQALGHCGGNGGSDLSLQTCPDQTKFALSTYAASQLRFAATKATQVSAQAVNGYTLYTIFEVECTDTTSSPSSTSPPNTIASSPSTTNRPRTSTVVHSGSSNQPGVRKGSAVGLSGGDFSRRVLYLFVTAILFVICVALCCQIGSACGQYQFQDSYGFQVDLHRECFWIWITLVFGNMCDMAICVALSLSENNSYPKSVVRVVFSLVGLSLTCHLFCGYFIFATQLMFSEMFEFCCNGLKLAQWISRVVSWASLIFFVGLTAFYSDLNRMGILVTLFNYHQICASLAFVFCLLILITYSRSVTFLAFVSILFIVILNGLGVVFKDMWDISNANHHGFHQFIFVGCDIIFFVVAAIYARIAFRQSVRGGRKKRKEPQHDEVPPTIIQVKSESMSHDPSLPPAPQPQLNDMVKQESLSTSSVTVQHQYETRDESHVNRYGVFKMLAQRRKHDINLGVDFTDENRLPAIIATPPSTCSFDLRSEPSLPKSASNRVTQFTGSFERLFRNKARSPEPAAPHRRVTSRVKRPRLPKGMFRARHSRRELPPRPPPVPGVVEMSDSSREKRVSLTPASFDAPSVSDPVKRNSQSEELSSQRELDTLVAEVDRESGQVENSSQSDSLSDVSLRSGSVAL